MQLLEDAVVGRLCMMDWKTLEDLVRWKIDGNWFIIIHMRPWLPILLASTWKSEFPIY